MISEAGRGTLMALLAEATTGVEVLEDIPSAAEDPDPIRVFEDSYLLEPVDPDYVPGEQIDPDQPFRATPAGRQLLFVSSVIDIWLRTRPAGPLKTGDEEAGLAAWYLLRGWCSTVTHTFAAAPLTATEACEAIPTLSNDVIENCIAAMVKTGLLEELATDHTTRYQATDWLRRGVGPLMAGMRQEILHPPEGDSAPIAAADVGAAFQLSLPLLHLPADASGSCSLEMKLEEEVSNDPAGVTVRVADGRMVSIEPRPDPEADARIAANALDWLDTVIARNGDSVAIGGDRHLAQLLLSGLHNALFE